MQDLQVVGVESGSLVVVSEEGTRYRVPVDDALRAKLRQTVPEPGTAPRLSPRQIQAQIRSGMSAQDVAGLTGAPLEYIQRFEGPVMAEREFVVQSAFGVPVRVAGDTGQLGEGRTFGTAIRERLHDIGAIGERWSSWKEEASGWVVKLSFTANHIDHDARWQFDHKKHSLVPLNTQAISLSHGEAGAPLQPRLRAVATGPADTSRFDSGAFAIDESEPPTAAPVVRPSAIGRLDDEPVHANQTADLLEALRRRRGERESANFDDDSRAAHPSTGSIRIVDVPADDPAEQTPVGSRTTQPQPRLKKGRAVMPSWDEIVFGARPDDDPA